MNYNNFNNLKQLLAMPDNWSGRGILLNISRPRKNEAINEAIKLKRGPDLDNKHNTIYYSFTSNYSLGVGKPGKEVYQKRGANENDMQPFIMYRDKKLDKYLTFAQLYKEFSVIKSKECLKIIAIIFFRMQWMLDHKKDYNNNWRLSIHPDITFFLNKYHTLSGMPLDVLIHYTELISLNEDVKYHTKGYDIHKGVGRGSNLQTAVSFIIHFLLSGKDINRMIDFVGTLMVARGVARQDRKEAIQILYE